MKAAKTLWRDAEGSVLIEATILTPMLLAVVLGVFEFSWIYFRQQSIEIGVRDAARYMSRIPITSSATPPDTNPCDQTDTNGTGASFKTNAGNIALYGKTTSGGTQRVTGWTGPVTITCQTTDNSTGTYADGATIYTITATTNFTDTALSFLGFSAPITITHKERFIGPG